MHTEEELHTTYYFSLMGYRTFSIYKSVTRKKLIDLLNTWSETLKSRDVIDNYSIVFDETIWHPSDPSSYGNTIQILITIYPLGRITKGLIDLNTGTLTVGGRTLETYS